MMKIRISIIILDKNLCKQSVLYYDQFSLSVNLKGIPIKNYVTMYEAVFECHPACITEALGRRGIMLYSDMQYFRYRASGRGAFKQKYTGAEAIYPKYRPKFTKGGTFGCRIRPYITDSVIAIQTN